MAEDGTPVVKRYGPLPSSEMKPVFITIGTVVIELSVFNKKKLKNDNM